MARQIPPSSGKPAAPSTTDRGQLKRARQRARRRAERFDNALRVTMATTEGAIVLWEMLAKCGIHSTVTALGFDQPRVMFMAGRQDIGLELLKDMVRVDGELYVDLERAMRTIDKREAEEEAAARTPSATQAITESGDEES